MPISNFSYRRLKHLFMIAIAISLSMPVDFSVNSAFAATSTAASSVSTSSIYSIADIVKNEKNPLTAQDIGTHRRISVAAPSIIYHWITLKSLKRMFPNKDLPKRMPLKVLGSSTYRSILAVGAPGFDGEGTFGWHNPIGATIGGSGEIYGNHEALLAMKLRLKNLRIGLVVTGEGGFPPSKALSDKSVRKQYDVILHVNAATNPDGSLYLGYIEWAIINPDIVEAVTADPLILTEEMKIYHDALHEFASSGRTAPRSAIEAVAGPQHSPMVSYSIKPESIIELATKIMANKNSLPKPVSKGWATF
jgi:hypothetical protein